MARHLGEILWKELATLQVALVVWLKKHDIAGAIGHDYSLYTAIEQEWRKAREALWARDGDVPPEGDAS